jgi:hypothetical protein
MLLQLSKITISVLFALAVLYPRAAGAQTITAATCSSTDVQTALNKVAADGTIVDIPAGTCTWTSSVTYNQVYSTTIQGQTTCTGTPASSCADNTVIIDNFNRSIGGDTPIFKASTAPGKSFRLTGITFTQINGGSAALTYNGDIGIGGSSQAVRLDHIHFNNINQTVISWISAFGVIDHVYANLTSEFIRPRMAGNGDGAFNSPTNFGTNQFVFVEDSTMTMNSPNASGVGITDCFSGGRMVIRYNILNYASVGEHTTGHAGDDRGCRAAEVYGNNFTLNGGNFSQFNGIGIESGTAMLWGNIFATSSGASWSHAYTAHNKRADSNTYQQTAPPGGWGYCGTQVNGIGSPWDQNSNAGTGYACLDQVGRGMGDLLSGNFPIKCNITLNPACNIFTGQWPREAVEPVYEWNDTWGCSGSSNCSFWTNFDAGITANRDYFLGYQNNNCPASSTGSCTGGVGVGTLASRPASCSANPMTFPAGNSPGVGYWATDTNTLYVCKSANTWTAYYTPYTYPHPLTVGSGTPPAPPTNLQGVVN